MLDSIYDYSLLVNWIMLESYSLNNEGLDRSGLLWYFEAAEKIIHEAMDAVNRCSHQFYNPLSIKIKQLSEEFLNSNVYRQYSSMILLQKAKSPETRNIIDMVLTYSKLEFSKEVKRVTSEIDSKMNDTLTAYHSELSFELSSSIERKYARLSKRYNRLYSK